MPWIQALDVGLIDFINSHHGTILASAMRSPEQLKHHLLARTESKLLTTTLVNSIVPAHKVSLDLKSTYPTDSDASLDEFGFLRMWSIYPA